MNPNSNFFRFSCKAVIFFACVFLRANSIAGDVSGTIVNQVWTSNNSPYRVVGDIQVAGLKIEPGVTVQFEGNYVFEVAGQLKALGTAQAPILFTQTNTVAGWKGLLFSFNRTASVLDHCTIEGARDSGLRLIASFPTVRNCTFRKNSSTTHGGGISIDLRTAAGDLSLENCVISDNTARLNGGGINALLGSNTLKMVLCWVLNNTANPSKADLTYYGGGLHADGSVVLDHCTVSGNVCNSCSAGDPGNLRYSFGGGIATLGSSARLSNCIIRNNQAVNANCGQNTGRAWGGGVYTASASFLAQNCIISSNACFSRSGNNLGTGVCIASPTVTAKIVNSQVAYNNGQGIGVTGGVVDVLSSIVFFNNNGGAQIATNSTTQVRYSNVQLGFPGEGNLPGVNPIFLSPSELIIVSGSPCIDRGTTNSVDNDVSFPPSLGTVRNDMGAFGGPGAIPRFWVGRGLPFELAVMGAVPGLAYEIQVSNDMLTWESFREVQISHVGDAPNFADPAASDLPRRFYRLVLVP
ncbi:MAG: hypothetical protein U1G07_10915 [Verrucomicrobiota bacterium]